MIGETVRQYRILSLLGSGSMGEVYLAHDSALTRRVAIKFLPPALCARPDTLARFYREARAAAAQNHPNIVTIYEVGEHKGAPFIAMEYIEGRTLADYLEAGRPSIAIVLEIAIALASALEKTHAAGVVHRDLKPTNIIIDRDERPRILDFGVAKLSEGAELTGVGLTIGTLAYMSPEQLDGKEIDAHTDLWSLGAVLYQLLTGQRPFRGIRTAALAYAILNTDPRPMSTYRGDIPADLERVVMRCLAKNPGNRYQSASELLADLRAVSSNSRLPLGSPSAPRSRPLLLAAITLSALLMVVLLWRFWPHRTIGRSGATTTLAILPIRNLGAEENQFFADGLTDDLIARASKIHRLRVISRLSVMPFKDEVRAPEEIMKRLRTNIVLDGSVLQVGERFNATVNLIDLRANEVIWAERFSAPVTDLFDIQAEIVRQVADHLDIGLGPEEESAIQLRPTRSLPAYLLSQRAREYYNRYTGHDNELSIQLFQGALAEDSLFTNAMAGLADAYTQRSMRFGMPGDWIDSAIAIAQRALTLDSTQANAHKAIGLAYFGRGLYSRALEANLLALRYTPNHSAAIGNAGMLSYMTGHLAQALDLHLRATAIEPTQGLIAAYVAMDYALLGEDDCARLWFDRALAIQPDLGAAMALRSYWELTRGNSDQAITLCQSALREDTTSLCLKQAGDAALFSGDMETAASLYRMSIDHSSSFAVKSWIPLAFVMQERGEQDSAAAILTRCREWDLQHVENGDETYEARHRLAVVSSLLDSASSAMDWYEQAIDAGWRNWRYDARDPLLRTLRAHPAYDRLRARMERAVETDRAESDQLDCQDSTGD